MHIRQIQKNLKPAIESAVKNVSLKIQPKDLPSALPIKLEIPRAPKHGDLTTNIAMRLAKNFSLNGVKLASLIKEELLGIFRAARGDYLISKVEVSAPGFINFWLAEEYLCGVLSLIAKEKDNFGKNDLGNGKSVNIEFVSANPTGPLTVAHGRQAAVGDALGRILEFSGYKVTKEFFINDAGIQIELLGKSISSRYLAENGIDSEFPEDGYHGEYIKDIAKTIKQKYGKNLIEKTPKNLHFISEFGSKFILKTIKEDLENFGVIFTKWSSQKRLSSRHIRGVLDNLRRKGHIYEKDGAPWFKSRAFGDDKDRVVIKRDGTFTYLAPDIAYHLDKYKRGFDKLIDIWGPDHHGYIQRLVASVEALGYKRETISILIVQLATLFRNGQALSMSTRKGEFITLREVMNEVGCDVAKFFFLMRKCTSHLDFDLEIAKKNSQDNPVFYIQYAHARIASIQDFGAKHQNDLKGIKYESALLKQPEELSLLRMLCQFPLAIEASAVLLEPYRMIEYLNELAKAFHSFYTKHRVVSEDNLPLTKARLALANGVKAILANGLRLLGVSFPERM